MHVSVDGYSPDGVDDPFEIIGAILDQPFLAGPIDKHRRVLEGMGAQRRRGCAGSDQP